MRHLVLTILFGCCAQSAAAHITLEVPHAAADTEYKAVFRVPHGCAGAATTAIRIRIPEGFVDAKPMPKPGWSVNVKTGNYAAGYKRFRADVKSGAIEIDFTSGNLPDAYYDEFVITGYLAGHFRPGDLVFFPVVQECGAASERWIEIPTARQAIESLKRPAPHLQITAASH